MNKLDNSCNNNSCNNTHKKTQTHSIDNLLSIAEQICLQSGNRLTERRREVLHCLLKCGKAMSAYELLSYWEQLHGSQIAAMTIYRALEFLESKQLVHKINTSNKYVACAYICQHQHHDLSQFLICSQCGSVTETNTDSRTLKALEHKAEEFGHQLDKPQLELYSLCSHCQCKSETQIT